MALEMCVSSLQYKEELLSLRITTLEQEEAVGHVSPLPLLWNIEYVKRKKLIIDKNINSSYFIAVMVHTV